MSSSTILSSQSLTGTTLDDLMKVDRGLVRIVGIEVQNWTKWSLTEPKAFCVSGTIKFPPRDIQPSFREMMVATKSVGVACGTFGSVSWLVNPDNDDRTARRIVVNWSNPFNHDIHTNWLALGISERGYTFADPKWTNEMYYDTPKKVGPLRFDRKQYYYNCEQVDIEDEELVVTGMMGTTHDAKIHVVVKEKK